MKLTANWNYPTSVKFGNGRIKELPDHVKAAGMKAPLLVTDPVLAKMPKAKAAEVAAAVKSEYGHKVSVTLIYLVKSKSNVKKAGRQAKAVGRPAAPIGSAAEWVHSIKLARQLLTASGSVANAVAILRAVEG